MAPAENATVSVYGPSPVPSRVSTFAGSSKITEDPLQRGRFNVQGKTVEQILNVVAWF